MRLTVFAPEGDFTRRLRANLDLFAGIETTWLVPADFLEDLAAAAAEPSPLLLYLTPEILPQPLPAPRILWQPLLERNTPAEYGVFLPANLRLPPLLQSAYQAPHQHAHRTALRWAVSWLTGQPSAAPPPSEELFTTLIDQPGVATLPADPTPNLAPYFEQVIPLRADHHSPQLRAATLARVQPVGRVLYVLTGAPDIPPPTGASLVHLPPTPLPPPDLTQAALWLSRITPDQPLPLSTFELEHLLTHLFVTHYPLAERLARRAGLCLRNTNCHAEAIWLYEALLAAAQANNNAQTVRDCTDELYWLRAQGPRPDSLRQATQTSLF